MGNKSKRRQVKKIRYIIDVADESSKKKHRPCGCGTWTAVKALERLINASFIDQDARKQILPKLIRVELKAKGGAAIKLATGIPECLGLENWFSLHGK